MAVVVSAAGIPVTTFGVIVSLGGLLFILLGAVVTYLMQRRRQSGKIDTSDASVLWTQSQAIITQLGSEKMKAEEQRDRIMDVQVKQVIPALEAMNAALKGIADNQAEIYMMIQKYDQRRKIQLKELQKEAPDAG